MNAFARIPIALALASALLTASAPLVRAACTYNTPVSSQNMLLTSSGQLGRIPAAWQRSNWLVSAVSPWAGEDWDLRLYQNSAADPTCVANLLTSSTAGGSVVDFVVGDMRTTTHADVYQQFTRFSGVNIGRAQWKDAATPMVQFGAPVTGSFTPDSLVAVYELDLPATGAATWFNLDQDSYTSTIHVFRNPGTGSFWTNRAGSVANGTGNCYVSPTPAGKYLVVIANDGHANNTFRLSIGNCDGYWPPPGTPYFTNHWNAKWYSPAGAWQAFAARSTGGDYDVKASTETGGFYPACSNRDAASSYVRSTTKAEIIVADFNHIVPADGYFQAHTYGYSGPPGVWGEFGRTDEVLTTASPAFTHTVDSTTVIETWAVDLTSGAHYNFYFSHSTGNFRLLLFRNPGEGLYFTSRYFAEFDQSGSVSYTAPATDRYMLAVVNDDGVAGHYTVGVTTTDCPFPTALLAGTAIGAASPDSWYEFTPTAGEWGVMAVRGATATDDWDLTVSDQPTGSAAPACIGPVVASSSYIANRVDFVALDFHTTPQATWYARAHHYDAGSTAGRAEWYQVHSHLELNGTPLYTGMAASDLVQAFGAWMESGKTYTIEFTPENTELRLQVFPGVASGNYVVPRSAAAASSNVTFNYTATRTGMHALVVTNDGAVTGGYTLRYGLCATPAVLASGVTQTAPYAVSTYTFTTTSRRFLAVGTRAATTDWDLRVSTTAGTGFPNCIGSTLVNSTYSTVPFVDFVVGNLGRSTLGLTYYVDARQYTAGATDPAQVLYDASSDLLYANDVHTTLWSMGGDRILRAFDVSLKSTETYTIHLSPSNSANLHVLLFRNPGSAAYWVGRSSALLDLPAATGTVTFTPPATDTYGAIVVSDDGLPCTFTLSFRSCPAVVALADTTASYVSVAGFASFTQATRYWTAVGVRSSGTDDYDLGVYSNPSGGAVGTCFTGALGSSGQANPPVTLDFVVGDFNSGANAPGTYYVRPYRYSGTGSGLLEWAKGQTVLGTVGSYARGKTSSAHALRVYDVYLTGGTTYSLYFAHTGAADQKALLFQNAAGGAYWAGRASRLFEATTHTIFTASTTGWYGLVVVNDNGLDGDFEVGFHVAGLDAGVAGLPEVTRLEGLSPNPARGDFTVEYALHEGAHVRVELLDMAGRRVTTLEDRERDAGTWRVACSSHTAGGRDVPPGVYFVRVRVGERVIGERKVAILR
ncbi:MAG: hypothetical protein U0704_05985 [Candidatus Eisenbacteria bacterium]